MVRRYDANALREEKYRRICCSEDDVRREIRTFAGTAGATLNRVTSGGLIIFACPFTVTKGPFVVPENAPGLTFQAAAKFPITAHGILSALFEVHTPLVTIRDILAYGDDTDHFAVLVNNLGSNLPGFTGDKCRVLDNDFYGGQVYADGSAGDAGNVIIRGNTHENVGAAHAASVFIDSGNCLVQGNKLLNGGGDVITLSANASRCRIIGNDASGPIHANASGGGNVIIGNNLHGGVVTPGAGDQVANNT